MPIEQPGAGLQSRIDAFRTAEGARFRHTLDEHGALQKAAGAGGVKGRLVAWVLASPGREGTFAGRSVKALVNLFGTGKFEASSSALQQSRETSVNNVINAILREGKNRLDADFSQALAREVSRRREEKGTSFSARDFTGLQDALTDLVARQRQARQDAIAAVQSGAPSERMQALNAAELEFAAKVLSPARADGHNQPARGARIRAWKFPEGVDRDKFNAVEKEFNAMSRQLLKHLNNTLKPPGEAHTVNSLLQEGRLSSDPDLEEARAAVQAQFTKFQDSYAGVLENLAQERAAPPSSPAPPPAAPAQPTPAAPRPAGKETSQQALQVRYRQAQSEAESARQVYLDVKRQAEGKKDAAGNLPAGEREKVEAYRKLAGQAQERLRQLKQEVA